MKLNKVMALALSGLMAVSMLAGCAGDPSNGDGGNTEVTPPASDAVSIMNEAQSVVKFSADADFDAALAAAAKNAKYTDIEDLQYVVYNTTTADKVYEAFNKKLPVSDGLSVFTGSSIIKFTGPFTAGAETTKTVLYKIENEGLDEEAALKLVATKMDMDDTYPVAVAISSGSTSNGYEASYTGRVSVVTVNTADEGKTASAYYIAVSITQSIARDSHVTA